MPLHEVPPGPAGVGAIDIPGPPTTAVVGGSLMNSCCCSAETGGFAPGDLSALSAQCTESS
ncbi:hypothetical protein DRW03_25685 [Corallococcus sp. H22C18031201]|nr:hypothetical protein DRW03_25685 [Corallococcus sp. H22C18031201]